MLDVWSNYELNRSRENAWRRRRRHRCWGVGGRGLEMEEENIYMYIYEALVYKNGVGNRVAVQTGELNTQYISIAHLICHAKALVLEKCLGGIWVGGQRGRNVRRTRASHLKAPQLSQSHLIHICAYT